MSDPTAPETGLLVVWTGPSYRVENTFGTWYLGEARPGFTEADVALLGPGFEVVNPPAKHADPSGPLKGDPSIAPPQAEPPPVNEGKKK